MLLSLKSALKRFEKRPQTSMRSLSAVLLDQAEILLCIPVLRMQIRRTISAELESLGPALREMTVGRKRARRIASALRFLISEMEDCSCQMKRRAVTTEKLLDLSYGLLSLVALAIHPQPSLKRLMAAVEEALDEVAYI